MIRTDYKPTNEITTPLTGTPSHISSGIIKAVMSSGEKISVARIDYEEYDEENFQYVISPYWEIVDGLPASVFQGIPGIDMDMRLKSYYRVNYIPVFISERTPSKNREDLWELLASVGLDYYDRFEWLLRTDMRAGNDNLIVERRRIEKTTAEYKQDILYDLQYGDELIVEAIESMADSTSSFNDRMFNILVKGIDVFSKSGKVLVDGNTRAAMIRYMVIHRMLEHNEYAVKKQKGIEKAKKEGKYVGRKPIEVDEHILCEVAKELELGIINVDEAMRRTKIQSRATFYRKLRGILSAKTK